MKKLFLLFSVLVLFLSVSCTTTDYTLFSSEDTENKVFFEEGYEYQVAETDNVEVKAAGLSTINGTNAILFNLNNKTSEDYSFTDSQIRIFGGTSGTKSWDLIGTWDAKSWYKNLAENAADTKRAVNFLGFLAVVDSIFTPHVDFDGSLFYDPADVFWTAAFADLISDDVSRELGRNLDLTRKTMLFSSTVSPEKQYSGICYFPVDSTYPDYKIVYYEGSEKLNFVFSRSNREEIIHPWTADRTHDLWAITYTHSFLSNKMGSDFLWLSAKNVGAYTGFNIYPKEDLSSFNLGITLKLCNHTWILAGCEIGGSEATYTTEDIFICCPELGVNYSYNWLNFEFKAGYDIPRNKFQAGAGIGVSF